MGSLRCRFRERLQRRGRSPGPIGGDPCSEEPVGVSVPADARPEIPRTAVAVSQAQTRMDSAVLSMLFPPHGAVPQPACVVWGSVPAYSTIPSKIPSRT